MAKYNEYIFSRGEYYKALQNMNVYKKCITCNYIFNSVQIMNYDFKDRLNPESNN